MPRVLIVGGSGYLGLAIGQALNRSGNYSVWGTARDAKKVHLLESNEINAVSVEDIQSSEITKVIFSERIDLVVDASSAYEHASAILDGVKAAAQQRAALLQKDSITGPKLGFIYTSGSWVHGDVPSRISDLVPPGSALSLDGPAKAVAWRPGHEQAILAARDSLDVAILRPSAIFGRGSWVWGTWWGGLLKSSKTGSLEPVDIPANEDSRTATVHVDDLAEAYVLAADRIGGQLGQWPVFDVYGETARVSEIIDATKSILGVKAPVRYAGTQGNPFFEALSCTNNADASRARTVLGWQPRHRNFIETLPLTVNAWKVVQA